MVSFHLLALTNHLSNIYGQICKQTVCTVFHLTDGDFLQLLLIIALLLWWNLSLQGFSSELLFIAELLKKSQTSLIWVCHINLGQCFCTDICNRRIVVCCPADSALPCPGCWPRGLASVSCCCARPHSTRPSSSTMWPDPDELTFSPWVRTLHLPL